MSTPIIIPVTNKADKLRFIKSQWNFYKGDNSFVPPIIMDREKLLDEKNPFYKHSAIQLFLAEKNGQIIGRIAAIINDNHNIIHNDNIGFFGFLSVKIIKKQLMHCSMQQKNGLKAKGNLRLEVQ